MELLAFLLCSFKKQRIAEDEPEKVAQKAKASFSRKRKRGYRNAITARMPNPMFPVSRRELAPSTRDI
jgi:hypothetical protein